MSDTLSLDPPARCGAGISYNFGLDSQPGNGFAAASAARFQDALANAVQARDSGNSPPDPDASASVGSAPAEATSSILASAASNAATQQASDGKPAASGALGDAWDWTKHQASSAGQAIGDFDAAHSHVLTRAAGAAQAVGAVAEGLAGAAVAGVGGAATATGVGAAPGVPAMIGGGALIANALDNGVAGVRTAWTGEFHHNLTSQAAGAGARALGASDQTAERITFGVDLAQGVAAGGVSIAAGIARKEASLDAAASVMRTPEAAEATAGIRTTEGTVTNIPADEVRFSQHSVSYQKTDRVTGTSYTYDDLTRSMKNDGWKGEPVDAVDQPDNGLTSMDNTHVRAARESGIDVKARVRDAEEPLTSEQIDRFTRRNQAPPTNWGEAISARINAQGGQFSSKNPYGLHELPRLFGKPE